MLFEVLTGERVFLISDTHFYHSKICSGSEVHFEKARHYNTPDEMNADIIRKWNNKITNNDVVVFLGDFLMNCGVKETLDKFKAIFKHLNCKKIYMIKGNHDSVLFKQIRKFIKDNPDSTEFDRIALVDHCMVFTYGDQNFICQHRDFSTSEEGDQYVLNSMEESKEFMSVENPIYLHGHTHSDVKISEFEFNGQLHEQYNLCWEAHNDVVNLKEIV